MSSKARPASGQDEPGLLLSPRLSSLDRYLRAAGIVDSKQRLRLARRVAQDLWERNNNSEEIDWVEIVASVDRLLSLEQGFNFGGDTRLSCRGRIAQYHSNAADDHRAVNARLAQTAAWAVPATGQSPMPTQALDLPRISMQWFWPAPFSRSAQGLVSGLCCLAIVLIP